MFAAKCCLVLWKVTDHSYARERLCTYVISLVWKVLSSAFSKFKKRISLPCGFHLLYRYHNIIGVDYGMWNALFWYQTWWQFKSRCFDVGKMKVETLQYKHLSLHPASIYTNDISLYSMACCHCFLYHKHKLYVEKRLILRLPKKK